YNSGPFTVTVDSMAVGVPTGWRVEGQGAQPAALESGQLATRKFTVTVADSARPTQPYFLEKPLKGAMYDWSSAPAAVKGLPFQPPLITARVVAAVLGGRAALER